MFGGHGLFIEALMVALIIDQRLYLKADALSQAAFAAAGGQPFGYATRTGRRVLTSYWSAPDAAMDSPAAMQPWARLALASALRAAASKPPPRAAKTRAAAAQATAAAAAPSAAAAPAAPRRRATGTPRR
ncbi:TfoX/Sxy family protein [Aquabacterium sp. OR-4]|uniref:TfoX/Sxy family protein n=1 Tax=Aquabacterium sp. OR-4 TaxID=2978127 RepID=UPI0028C9032E|nr:TfoX/Sxy family protein [Aquabacterium sp. OR-4]MDT7837405.1 TfoX/Sxy family protein [Aquabacterium sp. OR-4]